MIGLQSRAILRLWRLRGLARGWRLIDCYSSMVEPDFLSHLSPTLSLRAPSPHKSQTVRYCTIPRETYATLSVERASERTILHIRPCPTRQPTVQVVVSFEVAFRLANGEPQPSTPLCTPRVTTPPTDPLDLVDFFDFCLLSTRLGRLIRSRGSLGCLLVLPSSANN